MKKRNHARKRVSGSLSWGRAAGSGAVSLYWSRIEAPGWERDSKIANFRLPDWMEKLGWDRELGKEIDNKNVGKTESCPSSKCTIEALLVSAENRSDIAPMPYTLFTDSYFSRWIYRKDGKLNGCGPPCTCWHRKSQSTVCVWQGAGRGVNILPVESEGSK